MAGASQTYRKLPGTGGGLAARQKLYLAEDHLLSVDQTGFTERYARFELGDIQAITARETNRWMIYIAIWAAMTALFVVPAVLVTDPSGEIFFMVLAFIMFLPLLYNLIQGRTCEARLYTAVSTQKLSSLNRLRRFYKVSNLLAPIIETRQGLFDPAQLQATARPDAPVSVQPVAAAPAVPEAEPETSNPERAVLWLSLALFGDAASIGLLFGIDRPAAAVLRLAFMLAITCLVVVGFATVPRKTHTEGLRRVLWSGFAYVLFSYVFLYFAFIMGSMDSVLPTTTAFDAVLPSHSSVSKWCNVASLVMSLVLGAIGLLTVANARLKP